MGYLAYMKAIRGNIGELGLIWVDMGYLAPQ